MEPFLGEIIMFGGNFAPRSWAFCHGQLLAINSNTALFSILGTTYGGDGRTTFGLPDLRGRTAIGAGNGPGLSDKRLGAKGGSETVVLTQNDIPSHTHTAVTSGLTANVGVTSSRADSTSPGGNHLAEAREDTYASAAADGSLGGVSVSGNVTVGNTGGSQAHNNMQPWLAINYIICTQGTFPSRN